MAAALPTQGPSAAEMALQILARAGGGTAAVASPALAAPAARTSSALAAGAASASGLAAGGHPSWTPPAPAWLAWLLGGGGWTPTRRPLFLATPTWTAWQLAVVAYV
jgi:hypothetical protein